MVFSSWTQQIQTNFKNKPLNNVKQNIIFGAVNKLNYILNLLTETKNLHLGVESTKDVTRPNVATEKYEIVNKVRDELGNVLSNKKIATVINQLDKPSVKFKQ